MIGHNRRRISLELYSPASEREKGVKEPREERKRVEGAGWDSLNGVPPSVLGASPLERPVEIVTHADEIQSFHVAAYLQPRQAKVGQFDGAVCCDQH